MSKVTNERLAYLYWRRCQIRGELNDALLMQAPGGKGEEKAAERMDIMEAAVKKAYIAGLKAAKYYHMYTPVKGGSANDG